MHSMHELTRKSTSVMRRVLHFLNMWLQIIMCLNKFAAIFGCKFLVDAKCVE